MSFPSFDPPLGDGITSVPIAATVHVRASERRTTRHACLVVLACAVFAGTGACTHLIIPYYREDQTRQVAPVEEAEVDHRLLLIGDAGDPDPSGEPTLKLLAQRVSMMPTRTTVAFLGDNVYERGMPKVPDEPQDEAAEAAEEVVNTVLVDLFASRRQAERELNAQIDAVRGVGARAIFVPGNHDWDPLEDAGWDRILEQEMFIAAAAADGSVNVGMLPTGGCPGPTAVPLGSKGELIVLDTEWWLETRADGKPTPDKNPTHCEYTTEKEVRQALVAQLEAAARENRKAIVAAHHPLESEGPHGGYVDPLAHLFPFLIVEHYVPFYVAWFPLPVFGSIVVETRRCCSPSAQDMSNGRNQHMRNAIGFSLLEAERRGAAPVAYAAGHDHSLQVFESAKGARYLLVSGLGSSSRASDVGTNRQTLFAHANSSHPGFMEIDFLVDGNVRLAVVEADSDHAEGTEVFSMYLAQPPSRSALRAPAPTP